MLEVTFESQTVVEPNPKQALIDAAEEVHEFTEELVDRFRPKLRLALQTWSFSEQLPEPYAKFLADPYRLEDQYMSCIVLDDNSLSFDFQKWKGYGLPQVLFWEIEYGGRHLPPTMLWREMLREFSAYADSLVI